MGSLGDLQQRNTELERRVAQLEADRIALSEALKELQARVVELSVSAAPKRQGSRRREQDKAALDEKLAAPGESVSAFAETAHGSGSAS